MQAIQDETTAQTAQAQIAATADVTDNSTWASTQLAETQSNNAVAPQLAQENDAAAEAIASLEANSAAFAALAGSKNAGAHPYLTADILEELLADGFHVGS